VTAAGLRFTVPAYACRMTTRDGLAVYGWSVRTNTDIAAVRQRPPLSKRLSAWHWTALDYLGAALFGVILLTFVRHGVVRVVATPHGLVPYRTLAVAWPLAVLLVVVSVVAVATRRRHPVLMLGVLLAGSLAVAVLTVPANGSALNCYFLSIAYVLYLVAATYEHRQAAVRAVAAVLATVAADATLGYMTGDGFLRHGGLGTVCLSLIIAWSSGYIVRQRRRYAVSLQDEAASKAVAVERLRIARELHDVVAHSMSVIAVQAGYGQYVIDSQPADARDALNAIQATSREALEEMRRMLGALRQADEAERPDGRDGGPAARSARNAEGVPLFPAPGLAGLDRLLARTASAGLQVDVRRYGTPRELPASIDLSAYRIVQEALTNVVKHARASSCQVLIGFGPDELVLEVTDQGAGIPALAGAGVAAAGSGLASTGLAGTGLAGTGLAGTGLAAIGLAEAGLMGENDSPAGGAPNGADGGHGIIGMRERVSLLGGEFTAGPLPGYGFSVSAHIPLPAAQA
jgi:signal transduction histidine kinase